MMDLPGPSSATGSPRRSGAAGSAPSCAPPTPPPGPRSPSRSRASAPRTARSAGAPICYEYRMYRRLQRPPLLQAPVRVRVLPGGRLNVLVMQRVGPSISKIFNSHHKRFSDAHVVSIGVQLLDCLRAVHENGIVTATSSPRTSASARATAQGPALRRGLRPVQVPRPPPAPTSPTAPASP